ncbi:transport and Golgi organization protein 1 homolog isoform X1 [Felis catus]|uniref:transport and Golgi organization protein 1 homolog isoform X1 n=1 Tax=Felis catus TaxID=9685 RepID=UPI001D19C5A4|nr:transport and Golgi organization protein 1 homolog isoform X1 [Felis catus]
MCGVLAIMLVGIFTKLGLEKAHWRQRKPSQDDPLGSLENRTGLEDHVLLEPGLGYSVEAGPPGQGDLLSSMLPSSSVPELMTISKLLSLLRQCRKRRLNQSTCTNSDIPLWLNTHKPPARKDGPLHHPTKDKTNRILYIMCGVLAVMLVGIFTKLGLEKEHWRQRKPSQVNVQQKTAKSNTLEKENTELAEAISMWEQKIHLQEAKRESNIHSAEALKLKSEDANGQLEELRAWRSNKRALEARIKDVEDIRNALSSTKAIREETAKSLKERGDVLDEFYEERKMATAKNLDMTNCELVAMKNQMATAEENLKIATRDIDKCKQEIEQTREQLQKAELTFTHQVAVYERNAAENWIKTQIWEMKMAGQSREIARLKYRLVGMEGERLVEAYRRWRPMPGSPEMQNAPRREPSAEAGVTPMSHNYKQSTNNAEKDKGSVDPWRPPPSTGRFCTPYPRGHRMISCAHPPPVPGSGPSRNPPPAPLGPFSDPHVAPVSNNNTDSTKRITEDKAIMNARGPGPSPGSPCRLSPMDHPSPPVTGDGPPPPPPPAPPRTKFGLRLRKFPRNLLRFCLCSCCVSSNTSSRRSSQSLRRMRTSWTLNYDQ